MSIGMKQKTAELTRQVLRTNAVIWIGYLLLIALAGFLIATHDKPSLHLRLNQLVGHPAIDTFFYYVTYLGDGSLVAFMLLAIVVYNVRTGMMATTSFLTATSISNLLKYTLFDDVNRPTYYFNYFDKEHPLKLVEGVSTHIHNSFPSGHATQAFSILLCLTLMARSPLIKLLFFSLAVLASYSRVYLSQHWLNDILAGSLIGTICCLFWYFFIQQHSRFDPLNTSLLALIKRNGH